MSVATELIETIRRLLVAGEAQIPNARQLLRPLDVEVRRIEQELALSDLFLGRRGTPAIVAPNPGWRRIADEPDDADGDGYKDGPRVMLWYPEWRGQPALMVGGYWCIDEMYITKRPYWRTDRASSDIALTRLMSQQRKPTHWMPEAGPDAP
jgi:hypothetical protein